MFQHALMVDDIVAGSVLPVQREQIPHMEACPATQHIVDLACSLNDAGEVVDALGADAAQGEPDSSIPAADAGLQSASSGRAALEHRRQVLGHEGGLADTTKVAWNITKGDLVI